MKILDISQAKASRPFDKQEQSRIDGFSKNKFLKGEISRNTFYEMFYNRKNSKESFSRNVFYRWTLKKFFQRAKIQQVLSGAFRETFLKCEISKRPFSLNTILKDEISRRIKLWKNILFWSALQFQNYKNFLCRSRKTKQGRAVTLRGFLTKAYWTFKRETNSSLWTLIQIP